MKFARPENKVLCWLYKEWSVVLLASAALLLSITVIAFHGQAMSIIDEWSYIDYLYKIPTQGFVRQGEYFGFDALHLMSCYGEIRYGQMGPPCADSYPDPSLFPYAGIQSAQLYTPVFFAPVWLGATILSALPLISLLTGARLVVAMIFVVTVILLHQLMKDFGINRLAIVAIILGFIVSPYSWWTYTYLSTDAPAVLVTVVLLILARKYLRNEISAWWIFLASAVAITIKSTNLLAIGLTALYLILTFCFTSLTSKPWLRVAEWKSAFRGSGVLSGIVVSSASILFALVFQLAWNIFVSINAVGPSADQGIGRSLTFDDLVLQATSFLQSTITSNVNLGPDSPLAYPIPVEVSLPLTWLCIAGVLGALFLSRKAEAHTPFVITTVIMTVLSAPFLAILIYKSTGTYYDIPPRYGGVLLPAFFICAGFIAKQKFVTWIFLGYAVTFFFVALALTPWIA